jgi:Phage integrase family
VCAEGANPRGIHGYTGPSQALSLGPGVPEASFYALCDQAALKLSHSAQNGENHLAGGRTRVHLLGERHELDAESFESFECAKQMRDRASESVESPDHSQPLRDIAEIMLDTGMRPEEVFRIRAENIDFKQMTIFNPFGKTKAACRTIPMTDNVSSRLKGRVKESERLATPFVFSSPASVQTPIGSVKKAHRAVRPSPHLCDQGCRVRHEPSDPGRDPGSHEHSDDHAIRSPGCRGEAESDS